MSAGSGANSQQLASEAILQLVQELRHQRAGVSKQTDLQQEMRDLLLAIHNDNAEMREMMRNMLDRQNGSERRISLIEGRLRDFDERLEKLETGEYGHSNGPT